MPSARSACSVARTRPDLSSSSVSVISSSSRLGRQAGNLERFRDDGEQVAAAELQRRQVDRHLDRLRPARGVVARLLQHEGAELTDETGLLGDGDELRRRDHAACRVTPAHQRLAAGDRAGGELDKRLVVDLEITRMKRGAQVELKLPAVAGAGIHLGLEEAERALAFALGAIKCHVGVLEELVRLIAVAGRDGDADACPGGDDVAV